MVNYGIADILNKTILNEYHLPIHHCDPRVYPDFIALNAEKAKFHQTPATALGFYSYDRTFDKIDGLYNAIYYNDKRLLKKYKKLYADIRFVIGPDYSLFDNIWIYENESRLLKIRVIMLWFLMEIGAIVIPNAIYIDSNKLPEYLSGFEKCTVMCFSTKGQVRYARNRARVKETVKYVVDHFPLKMILVYSACGKDDTSLKLFEYATSQGIEVRIVDNTLRRQNQRHAKQEVV
ncbi:MAG: DUF4417 domain-containing protein [Lachnospiraceae bacterium]|nr:DUF4417 domain-containing protein [Lachnospiraceae bacterium]